MERGPYSRFVSTTAYTDVRGDALARTVLLLWCTGFLLISASAERVQAAPASAAGALLSAHKKCATLFDNLKKGKTEDIAGWIIDEMGFAYPAEEKLARKAEFKEKLDAILVSPPVSYYGQLDAYDLIDESYLPGSKRYFRLVYISYHEGGPLLWEFRYYVKGDGTPSLHFVTWTEANPFEYMATSAMLLPVREGRSEASPCIAEADKEK